MPSTVPGGKPAVHTCPRCGRNMVIAGVVDAIDSGGLSRELVYSCRCDSEDANGEREAADQAGTPCLLSRGRRGGGGM